MEVFIRSELHWVLKLTHSERQEIFRIAKILKIRPSVLVRSLIEDGLKIKKLLHG